MSLLNYIYTASGAEGNYIVVDSLKGKTILILVKGKVLTPAVSLPTPEQYSYDATLGRFDFGNDFETGQCLQLIYR